MESSVGEAPAKGLRAWTPGGLKNHGLNKTHVPPQTGGHIIFQDAEAKTFAIQWDTGAITVHCISEFAQGLVCIGMHQNLNDYLRGKEEI